VNFRWYIPVFVAILAFFGIRAEQSAVPNQEIVVQFNAGSISSDEANEAISEITNQLKSIGVEDVQVSEMLDGKLKVTYYSTIDVTVIKNLFYKEDKLQFNDTDFIGNEGSSKIPFGNTSNTYKLDVIKLQKEYGFDLGLKGLPVALKFAKDQYVNQISALGTTENNFSLRQNFKSVAYKNYCNVSLLIDTTSHKIPEVRAGPLA